MRAYRRTGPASAEVDRYSGDDQERGDTRHSASSKLGMHIATIDTTCDSLRRLGYINRWCQWDGISANHGRWWWPLAVHGGDTDACRALLLDAEMKDAVIKRLSVKHAYQQVADVIAARIETGRYTIKLPGERDLAEEFGVSYITVRHATAVLRERGLIVSIHGRGTFVASALVDEV